MLFLESQSSQNLVFESEYAAYNIILCPRVLNTLHRTSISPDQLAAPELFGSNPEMVTTSPLGAYPCYQSHQWLFSSSSGSGYTIWYFSRSDSSIQSPPMVPQSKTGHLYVHFDASTKTHRYWMLGHGGQWERASKNMEYPLNHDQVLSICGNGEPSWVTRATTNTTDSRKGARSVAGG